MHADFAATRKFASARSHSAGSKPAEWERAGN